MKAATLAKKQNWNCYYCNCTMSKNIGRYKRANSATIDHKIPSSRGGSNQVENLVAACWRCNTVKGSMTDSEFIVRYGHDYSKLPKIEPDAKAKVLRLRLRKSNKVRKIPTTFSWIKNKKLKKTPYKPLIPSVATLADCLPKIVLKDDLDRKVDQAMANIEERILLAEWRLSFSKYEFSKWKKLRKKAQQKR